MDVIRGKHQLGFGFNVIRVQNNTISGFQENGNFTFNSTRTGLGLADFLTGLPNDLNKPPICGWRRTRLVNWIFDLIFLDRQLNVDAG